MDSLTYNSPVTVGKVTVWCTFLGTKENGDIIIDVCSRFSYPDLYNTDFQAPIIPPGTPSQQIDLLATSQNSVCACCDLYKPNTQDLEFHMQITMKNYISSNIGDYRYESIDVRPPQVTVTQDDDHSSPSRMESRTLKPFERPSSVFASCENDDDNTEKKYKIFHSMTDDSDPLHVTNNAYDEDSMASMEPGVSGKYTNFSVHDVELESMVIPSEEDNMPVKIEVNELPIFVEAPDKDTEMNSFDQDVSQNHSTGGNEVQLGTCPRKPEAINDRNINHGDSSQPLGKKSVQGEDAQMKTRRSLVTRSPQTEDAPIRTLLEQILSRMSPDDVSLIVKTDPLIQLVGEEYLKKHNRGQIRVPCANLMRKYGLLVFHIQRRIIKKIKLIDLLDPRYFPLVVAGAKAMAGYNEELNTYHRHASIAFSVANLMKDLCDLICRLIITKDSFVLTRYQDPEVKLKLVKRFQTLMETRWNFDMCCSSCKLLPEKQWEKPTLLAISEDILKLRDYLLTAGDELVAQLEKDETNEKLYAALVDVTLCMTILCNSTKREDVQCTEIDDYLKPRTSTANQRESLLYKKKLGKMLAASYKRVVTSKKLTRPVVVFFPEKIQLYIQLLLRIRFKFGFVPVSNRYLFAYPRNFGSDDRLNSDELLRKYAGQSGINNPELMTTNRLRKQISTIMQLLDMTPEEFKNLSAFLNDTEETGRDLSDFDLSQDLYQVAKLSKLLILIDRGEAGSLFQGRGFNEIQIDPRCDLVEEDNDIRTADEEYFLLNEDCIRSNDDNTNGDRASVGPTQKCEGEESRLMKKKNLKTLKASSGIPNGHIRWNTDQKRIVREFFQDHIKNKRTPKKHECVVLKNKYPKILHNIDWDARDIFKGMRDFPVKQPTSIQN